MTGQKKFQFAPDVLSLVKHAAEMQGRSLSDLVVSAAQEAARQDIDEAQIIWLSERISAVLTNGEISF